MWEGNDVGNRWYGMVLAQGSEEGLRRSNDREAHVSVLECSLCVSECVCVGGWVGLCVCVCARAGACVCACVYVCNGRRSCAHTRKPARVPDGISCQSFMQITCL